LERSSYAKFNLYPLNGGSTRAHRWGAALKTEIESLERFKGGLR